MNGAEPDDLTRAFLDILLEGANAAVAGARQRDRAEDDIYQSLLSAIITLSATLAVQQCDRRLFLRACEQAFALQNPADKEIH